MDTASVYINCQVLSCSLTWVTCYKVLEYINPQLVLSCTNVVDNTWYSLGFRTV